jgi:hypothetical protein
MNKPNRWLVVTDLHTEEGPEVEIDQFEFRSDADRFASRQIQREEVERVVVTDRVRLHND